MAKHPVFISWSGARSRHVADALRVWLPMLIQAVGEPFMSEHMEKGRRSLSTISAALEGTKVGIVCLTPENLTAPWILYEAGALSKTVDDETRLCTYLLGGLKRHEVPQPLGMFQATTADKDDSRKLVHAINNAISDEPLPKERVNALFEKLWPDLEQTLNSLPKPETEVKPQRSVEDMVQEILTTVRTLASTRPEQSIYSNYDLFRKLQDVPLNDEKLTANPAKIAAPRPPKF